MDIQKMMNAVSAETRRIRSQYHLTLGEAIEALEKLPGDAPVVFDIGKSPALLDSYRGYYDDLAFSVDNGNPPTVDGVLALCRRALDATFGGYKGGDFVMTAETPLWVAEYGEASGIAVIGITPLPGGSIQITTKLVD